VTGREGISVEPDPKAPTEEAFVPARPTALEHALTAASSSARLAEIHAALVDQSPED
jgi:hypothetical protein